MDPLGSSLVVAIIDECGPLKKVVLNIKRNSTGWHYREYSCDQGCQCHLNTGRGYGDGKGSAGNGLGEGKGSGYEIAMYEVN
jgi:hypothetical protein